MAHLPPIVSDLAMILLVAGITTILFKKLNQPLVLGYRLYSDISLPVLLPARIFPFSRRLRILTTSTPGRK